jgi:putative addiction module killer protein
VIEVRQTEVFSNWLRKLRDQKARARIQIRIRRLSLGNFGDVKPVGEGVSELRIDYGPGYRVYFQRIGSLLVLLLVGGAKRTQEADIAKARALAKEAKNGA